MDIDLKRDSDLPVGVQLAWTLRARIVAGELAPGERLPGVRELAALAGVNANTARAVYARLEADGLLRSEHGRGTFVAPDVAVDDRLSAAVRGALAEAATAGLDPRELAAALFGAHVPAPSPGAGQAAERRRALRAEIAGLERELAEERRARAVRDRAPGGMPVGGRLLGEDDLRAQRDALQTQITALRDPAPAPAPAAASARVSTRSATRPGVSWRPVFGG